MVNYLSGIALGVYIISGFNWKSCSSSVGVKTLILAREAFDLDFLIWLENLVSFRLRSSAN